MTDNTYQPAKVWTWDKSAGGAFANINRPVSGPTHEKTLPVGKHPLQLYSLGTPNGQKVTIMLEELLALGVNDSAIHEDVMIGAPDTHITGTTKDGQEVTIFVNGEWAF